ncbi:protein-disulfide reductase DsbD domain-containing protein [Paracoccus siganidrum]|uniref:protein-disulfide reductase DsbD domain-containing protein n=1 Tax=Paracoccus siganidrum TaxID=1276757 RepID=UPI001F0B9750|nr:protein-disulfide reductase DsbD domain-containing protein [Paracoccus siganidrum]
MNRIFLIALVALAATPVMAEPLPPGLAGARLLPGWTDGNGDRVAALELELEPGWKTYWRSPGDSGLPPEFDWSGSENLAGVTFHWPAPEAILSGGDVSLGFHDRLVLPFTAHAARPGTPVELAAEIDLGLCERICVPARLALTAAAPADRPDPRIEAALAQGPRQSADRPACRIVAIEDGMQVSMRTGPMPAKAAAIELDRRPEVWVSGVEIDETDAGLALTADLVPPEGKPFDLRPGSLRLTLIGPDGAVEMRGCDPEG